MEKLVFDSLEPVTVPAMRVGNVEYVLTEASEAAASRYRNFCTQQLRFGTDGKLAALGNVADAQALLVSLCLWEIKEHNGAPQRLPVPLQTIQKWPSRVVGPLFEQAKRISGIDQETEETIQKRIDADTAKLEELRASKNGQATTEGNSPESGTLTLGLPMS